MKNPAWLLNGEPFEVQAAGDELAGFNKGFLLWMEQGLGKTGTALQNWQRWRHRVGGPRAPRLIVVTLNSMRLAWRDEIKKWVKEPLDIEVSPERPHINDKVDVYICNYEALAGQGRGWGSAFDRALELATQRPTMLVVDECHRIKNYASRWSKSVRELGKDCIARRGLSGTPMGQDICDLYPQFRLAGQCEGVNPVIFRKRYAKLGGYMGKQIVGINEERLPEIDRMKNACSFRALKSEWTDLPPKMPPVTIPIELSKPLVPHYRSMLAEFYVELADRGPDDPIVAQMVVTQMVKLQQISSGFIYDNQRMPQRIVSMASLPKFKALEDIIDGLGDASKLLVFCHFKPTAAALVDNFPGAAFMVGGMTPEDLEREKARFNQDDGPNLMILQISVGSSGHTLLGGPNKSCYTTVFFENNYVLIDREQAMDRNHRFGQKNPVSYYDFVSTEIERSVIVALQTKKSLTQAVIDNKRTIAKEFGL